ncbi:conserved protein of unknown function (plasmid) [Paraburkholderia dioscoreae]|uniref:Uncharacterized protein n=1 Tax=Paraburkholderia dioscoreae TaxID=2604047 RepID=A0A5Q4Z9K8_9BURK|nr:conserved protein of unknown function [Paraburkholderia dioscoreae]
MARPTATVPLNDAGAVAAGALLLADGELEPPPPHAASVTAIAAQRVTRAA